MAIMAIMDICGSVWWPEKCKSYMYIYLSMYMNAPVNVIQRLSLFGI